YTGSCSSLTYIGCASTTTSLINGSFIVSAGTIYILVGKQGLTQFDAQAQAAAYKISSVSFTAVPPPANATCNTAVTIGSLPFSANVVMAAASDEALGSDCDNLNGFDDPGPAKRVIWYSYFSPTTQYLQFSSSGSEQAVLNVFTGTCGSLTRVACTTGTFI